MTLDCRETYPLLRQETKQEMQSKTKHSGSMLMEMIALMFTKPKLRFMVGSI
jgi:hypothetical protein